MALAPARQLVTAGPHRADSGTLARLGAGGQRPAHVAGAVPVDRVAVAVPGTVAGVLAQRAPAVGVAGALAGNRVTAAIRVARTHLPTIWSPELRRTVWSQAKRHKSKTRV